MSLTGAAQSMRQLNSLGPRYHCSLLLHITVCPSSRLRQLRSRLLSVCRRSVLAGIVRRGVVVNQSVPGNQLLRQTGAHGLRYCHLQRRLLRHVRSRVPWRQFVDRVSKRGIKTGLHALAWYYLNRNKSG